jgi:hypothetical protein
LLMKKALLSGAPFLLWVFWRKEKRNPGPREAAGVF